MMVVLHFSSNFDVTVPPLLCWPMLSSWLSINYLKKKKGRFCQPPKVFWVDSCDIVTKSSESNDSTKGVFKTCVSACLIQLCFNYINFYSLLDWNISLFFSFAKHLYSNNLKVNQKRRFLINCDAFIFCWK